MNDEAKLEIWKRKLVQIESKVKERNHEKNILVNLLNEVKTKQNIRLNKSIKGLDLVDEISHLKDWVRFHEQEISIYKNKVNALETELSQKQILDQQFEDLEKEPKIIPEKVIIGESKIYIPNPEEMEKDIWDTQREEIARKEVMVGSSCLVEDDKEAIAITRLFDERPEIKAVRQQIKELFKDKKDIIRASWFKEKLTSIKDPINDAYKTLRSWKPSVQYNNKFVIYTVPIILLLLITGILFMSKPEITGFVAVTQEKTYTDNLDLVINESGNYTWTIDEIGDIQSIKASGRVKGNGTVKIYIEKGGQRYLIYDNKENR